MKELFDQLKLSVSYRREFTELLNDIARRDNTTPEEIIAREEIWELRQKDLPRNQRITRIKQQLRKWRYPRLTKAEVDFARAVAKLKLPNYIKITPPQNFEGDFVSIEVKVKSEEELGKAIKELDGIRSRISQLFALL